MRTIIQGGHLGVHGLWNKLNTTSFYKTSWSSGADLATADRKEGPNGLKRSLSHEGRAMPTILIVDNTQTMVKLMRQWLVSA